MIIQLYRQSRYKGFKEIVYATIKIDDAIEFFKSEKFLSWFEKNKDLSAKINPSLTNYQTYKIFIGGAIESKNKGNEYESSLGFKNFKKIWGKLIEFKEV